MNSRYPTLDIHHQRNSKYEPSTLEAKTCWSRYVIDRWMEVCVDLVANNVKKALSGAKLHGISRRLADTRPAGAKVIQGLALRLGAQQQDVQWDHIEAFIRYCRSQSDLAEQLNCPPCNVPDTNDHYRHYCVEPTVDVAR